MNANTLEMLERRLLGKWDAACKTEGVKPEIRQVVFRIENKDATDYRKACHDYFFAVMDAQGEGIDINPKIGG